MNDERFTATRWATTVDKEKFLRRLKRLVETDFRRTLFTKHLYRRLSNMFGHIAHFDQRGFYDVWFATPEKRKEWVDLILRSQSFGDPAWTWVDVENIFRSWLKDSGHAERLLAASDYWQHQ